MSAALVEAARELLGIAFHEATGLAVAVMDATRCLSDEESRNVRSALGALADLDARLASQAGALEAARLLLVRARDGAGR